MGLPILRLPVVALKVLLDYLNNVEFCENFIVPIHFEALENFQWFGRRRRNLKIGELVVPVVTIRENDGVEKIRTFWNTKADGMIVFMDYFKNNLNLPIEQLNFARDRLRAIRTIVTHINTTQTVVRNVLVERNPRLRDDDFEFILRNVSAVEKFSSYLELFRDFNFDGSIRAKSIEIRNGHWFTLQNLLRSTENEKISVRGPNFEKNELRRFLREWRSGRFPLLKEVNLATNVSYKDVTRDLFKRRDKCDNNSGRRVEAFRGNGNSYGTVYPDESGQGFFRMRFYNSRLL
ncbi:hypothetical protein CAEBREN_19932 [Caenorhabditis brenneri]|uniref:Sdz-33 F-box domain-containing protein n=1 Tax=Caenorhabditis brenneri TaxID=135651 RepID=G0NPI9_CAEBE|nr:hypothetical protein CAEBREN_19932 [Caenorhabditis brenneri]